MDEPRTSHADMKAAFLAAYDAHADELYRYCLMKVSDRERAQDLVQDTFMKYWQELRKGTGREPIQNPRAFLYRLARNLVIDWYRRKKAVSLDDRLAQGIDVEGEGSDSVMQPSLMREALGFVQMLDESSREAVTLRYLEGWTPAEIGALTNESANAISVRINRALAKIRTTMHAIDPEQP